MFFDKKLKLSVPENEDERFLLDVKIKAEEEVKSLERQIKLNKLLIKSVEKELK